MVNWEKVDRQMDHWRTRLQDDDVQLTLSEASNVATCMAGEIDQLSDTNKLNLATASHVPINSRIDEILAFQIWMDIAHSVKHPAITRAQVITQNYICFVYLKEAWFEALRNVLPSNSVTARCCEFLLSDPLREFRNAFAHGNWKYLDDFSRLEYWARRKGSGANELRNELSQQDLNFWQALSRCTAYVTMVTLTARGGTDDSHAK